MYQLIAILDAPSTKSFGMTAFLARKEGSEAILVYGLTRGSTPLVLPSSMTVDEFIHGNCRDLRPLEIELAGEPEGLALGWIGTGFEAACRRLDAPSPKAPAGSWSFPAQGGLPFIEGILWIAAAAEVSAALESWLLAAAPQAIIRHNAGIADLMGWCLPDRLETEAAKWYTAPDETRRELELSWALRLRHDSRQLVTRAALVREFRTVIDGILRRSLP